MYKASLALFALNVAMGYPVYLAEASQRSQRSRPPPKIKGFGCIELLSERGHQNTPGISPRRVHCLAPSGVSGQPV